MTGLPAPGPPVRTIFFIADIIRSRIVPRIIDYPVVLETLTTEGLRCNYHNGGAFGFGPEAGALVRGWIGPADVTILPNLRPMSRQVSAPYEAHLAQSAKLAWEQYLPGPLWAMPASHWSYELRHGSWGWLGEAVAALGLDAGDLAQRTNAAAIEFLPAESGEFRQFAQRLLEGLSGSDFTLAFSGRGTICTVHHHKQLWWTTCDATAAQGLDVIVPAFPAL
jgi:hypothetical protein